jgi:Cu(I)/Ag(I) efflux system membrane fusion protein
MIGDRVTTIVRTARERPALSVALALLVLVLAAGTYLLLADRGPGSNQTVDGVVQDGSGKRVLYWHDPMVPQERYPGPGKSSMNMDLIPKYADEAGSGGVTVSPAVMQNLGIRLARVEVRDIAPVVRAVGRVDFDQRLISEVQTLTPGFVETLTVRAEGEPIGAGRVIAQVYSPDLLGAQNEYRSLLTSRSPAAASVRSAARSRLLLLGAPSSLVARLERGGAPQRTYPVVAQTSGVVTTIGARPGAQVGPGQSIVTIQGLSRVLVVADVPEAALGNIRVGQPAEISFPAYPGDVRKGRIDYIFPSLNTQSRTAQLRITISNPGGRLKSGMFANVAIEGAGGMATVVPSEAVIDTGRRQMVIVKRVGGFIPQEVRIGRDYDQWTEIVDGLRPDEQVVASGQFLIDSEASLSGFLSRLESGPAPAPGLVTSRGVVTSVDGTNRLVSIQHGAIPELDWPAMTMTFQLRQPGMLRGLRRGLKVEFAVNSQPQGNHYVIERIRPEPAR